MTLRRRLLLVSGLLLLVLAGSALVIRPSNERDWIEGQELLPTAAFRGEHATIRNVRNFRYRPDGSALPAYEGRTYDLSKLESVWFILAPFDPENRGPAHTFLSFGFADSQYVAISVEARREKGEEYSIAKGLLRQYEIMYVIGDERDLIGLRTNIRGDEVYVYPIKTTPDRVRRLFVQMLERANALAHEPEFYNTLWNNCTTNILEHANQVARRKIPYGKDVLLPGNGDALALRLGLIDSNDDLAEVRRRYLVNARAKQYADAPDFSTRIRQAE